MKDIKPDKKLRTPRFPLDLPYPGQEVFSSACSPCRCFKPRCYRLYCHIVRLGFQRHEPYPLMCHKCVQKNNSELRKVLLRLSCSDKTERHAALFVMNKTKQTIHYRRSLIRYAKKHSVIKAALLYHSNRRYVYRWTKRYGAFLQSRAARYHQLHCHPNQR